MSQTDFKPNPKNMKTEELELTLSFMQGIDEEKHKDEIADIEQELASRKNQ